MMHIYLNIGRNCAIILSGFVLVASIIGYHDGIAFGQASSQNHRII